MECLDSTPEVIDHFLIQKCLEEQRFKGEAGRLARMEGIPWDVINEIRIEFKNILRIDHLWVLPALTKLSLSNNFLENIENLESLVNLVELNLSFNKISKIENLEKLINLEILILFENLIELIENVDNLKKLSIVNIGNNIISDREQVLTLRHHKKLQSLNMTGNPCAESDKFRIYVSIFLPQLRFYAYKLITEEERVLGAAGYKDSLLRIMGIEAIERATEVKLEEEEAEAELHAESFVEFLNTNHLFKQMFEQDAEGKALSSMSGDAVECNEEFRDNLLKLTMEIFECGQEQFDLRKNEVDRYLKFVKDTKTENQKESINEMESFTKRKDEVLAKILQMQEDLINRVIPMEDYLMQSYDIQMEFEISIIPQVWKKLMGLELKLYEQLEEANEIFEHTLTDMIVNFIETAQGAFAQIRMLVRLYAESIAYMANQYLANSVILEHFIIAEEMIPYISDKDALNNALSVSQDTHLQIIDIREDRLINRAKKWLDNLVDNLQHDEINRNRAKILEINHFLDINKEQLIEEIKVESFHQTTSEEYNN